MAAREITVCCGFCNGTGQVPLSGAYFDTLVRLIKVRREITGAKLAEIMGIKATAMNNRLARLERHGLVRSRRSGRERFYSPFYKW